MEDLGYKAYLLIRDLCQKGNISIHDIRVFITDIYYYLQRYPMKVLQGAEK